MRPVRLMLLIFCFIAVPIILTCISLLRGSHISNDVNPLQNSPRSRFKTLLSFRTPSSLFPPSAIISLAAENSTFFLARPAAFGPGLPQRGLSGQLWIGRGFGDDSLLSEEDLKISGFELGCSDVPDWGQDKQFISDGVTIGEKVPRKSQDNTDPPATVGKQASSDTEDQESDASTVLSTDDGTDDHLHRPLPDSNPAKAGKNGESAVVDRQRSNGKRPDHADIESLQESADIAGKIVMLSRGGCGFLEKVKWAQRRGGIALIVGDNERSGTLTIMYARGDTSNITIPAIFTSYTSAHLLSSLVPPERPRNSPIQIGQPGRAPAKDEKGRGKQPSTKKAGPVFTTMTSSTSQLSTSTLDHATALHTDHHGLVHNLLHAVGLVEDDDVRAPNSGNNEWMQAEDQGLFTTTSKANKVPQKSSATLSKPGRATTTVRAAGMDDFVIGVQDWRDMDAFLQQSATTTISPSQKVTKSQTQPQAATITAQDGTVMVLRGGSIIPGSGEYVDRDETIPASSTDQDESDSIMDKIKELFAKAQDHAHDNDDSKSEGDPEGLWITLTPTSVSASPFFDTLLVLVVSPLVTLTFVYGLLLLRGRIRRRRWRAPKSIVDRLPVRTYHTMATSGQSSTTSSQLASPVQSPRPGSPRLPVESIRARQRSQTTASVLTPGTSPLLQPLSTSPQPEKSLTTAAQQNPRPRVKKYKGRQIECVVCLEEYIDGESKVMSLPCGHEFHAECITPWLVNRRRTCPICKGDVVRSLQRSARGATTREDEDMREAEEQTSDDIQERAALSVPQSASAAIPIPAGSPVVTMLDEDVERADLDRDDERRPLLDGGAQVQPRPTTAGRWRNIISASINSLSGDTLRPSGNQSEGERSRDRDR